MGMGDTILKMSGIQKYFPGVHALDDAYLEVRSGEVMALVGENGAGKSTLMKILTGIYPKDGGTILYNANRFAFLAHNALFEFNYKQFRYKNQALFLKFLY